ncbi:PSD1 and planctomycete cytochrome C domain-containing protein [Urbifossiella limnaea]|uniref:Planctomycete cytochrome C n=1 Tax=Urbifossiella limnaea TaxID=2528023 RepID=A0A517Y0B6_9BACT|nr:PSD1 and planctomycete cytochrome C domain-containing protein [Urbifossiella limnaea]QDU23206.1 Planctomycete cytochrome C [Urbifossiella limnaea]
MRHALLAAAAVLALAPRAAADVDFARDVRPVLTEYCFACHGPDEKGRKADLRLDTRDGLTAAAKEVLARVTSAEPTERMPPPKGGKALTPAQVGAIKSWVEGGAKWSAHWAFETPKRPPVPATTPAVVNPIDAFVRARLLKDGLAPAPEASRETLIRRLSLDLTGLPPTPQEVDAFLADAAPNAYEKVVDRLLASPHYGERMAMPWLDYARFADSNGFQTDSSRAMWPWRDWVVRAFNRNLPYDQFTIQQLAGDMLANPTRDQIIATGFNRNHRLNGEGGLIGEEWRVETVIDRVDTTALTWLGMTAGCARCHDHKYDPISQAEYYRLFAFFNNVPESGTLAANRGGGNSDPAVTVPLPGQEAELAKLKDAVGAAEKAAADAAKELPKLVAAWEPGFKASHAEVKEAWTVLAPRSVAGSGMGKFEKQADGSYLAVGQSPPYDLYTVVAPVAAGPLSAVLLECLPDKSLPNQSVGRAPNGNFVLTSIEAEVTAPSLKEPRKLRFVRAVADYSQPGWDVKNLLGGDPKRGWAADGPTRRAPLKAALVADTAVEVPADATITVKLLHEALNHHSVGRFRLSVTGATPGTVTLAGPRIPPAVKAVLDTDPAKRTPTQTATLADFYRTTADGPVKRADAALAAARKRLADFDAALPTVMVMQEGTPRDAFVLVRGQYDRRGAKVTPGVPAALPPLPAGAKADRLSFARWVASAENPLTARVWANRAWEHFFGTGLVRSTENLGTQAEFPSHPELLDWLATEFVRLGWDMKAMHKLIVTSATYRQSSRVTPALVQRDPDNRLLARGPRFRLPGELVRDQALAAAGLLTRTLGGPSVRPYMPAGVWDEVSVYGDLRNYRMDAGPDRHRRTMYTVWKRTAAPPTMLLFDAPNREVCTVRRSRTNTPLQALALLNEFTYVEAARALAARMKAEGGADPLAYGFRVVTARRPTAAELAVLSDGYAADVARFRADPDAAKRLAGDAEQAALTLTANVLLNLDEVVTRE